MTESPPKVARRSAAARRNALVRHRGLLDPLTLDAERDLRAVTLIEQLRQVVDQAPPLTPEQIAELQAILNSADLDATGLENCGEQ